MKRAPRNTSLFGSIDLADALTAQLNIPLDDLRGKFSFEESLEAAKTNNRLMHGNPSRRVSGERPGSTPAPASTTPVSQGLATGRVSSAGRAIALANAARSRGDSTL